jgi:hypothetical protein
MLVLQPCAKVAQIVSCDGVDPTIETFRNFLTSLFFCLQEVEKLGNSLIFAAVLL